LDFPAYCISILLWLWGNVFIKLVINMLLKTYKEVIRDGPQAMHEKVIRDRVAEV
jgi:hypothetical protein